MLASERRSSSYTGEGDEEFMSMTEYTQHRTTTSSELKHTYEKLCRTARNDEINVSADVSAALTRTADLRWSGLDSVQKWLLQLCSSELLRLFGGMNIVDKGLLPFGVMTLLRSKKVTWQGVL